MYNRFLVFVFFLLMFPMSVHADSSDQIDWYPIEQMDLWVSGSLYINPEDHWNIIIHGTWPNVCVPLRSGEPEPWHDERDGETFYLYQIYVEIPSQDGCYQPTGGVYYEYEYQITPGVAAFYSNNYELQLWYGYVGQGGWTLQDWSAAGVSSFYCLSCTRAYLPIAPNDFVISSVHYP